MKFFSGEVFTLKYCFGRFRDEIKFSGCNREKEVICNWSTVQSFRRSKKIFINQPIDAELVDDAFIKH